LQVQTAALRGVDFLTSSQLGTGAITDQLRDPARFVLARRPSRSSVFKAMGGADVWHTVSSMAAIERAASGGHSTRNGTLTRARAFVQDHVHPEGGLSYWSITHGLCCETTAFAASTVQGMRRASNSVLRRVALPHGRWPQFILERENGYSDYSAAPSVTGWVLNALGSKDPRYPGGLSYLRESLADRDIWEGHLAYYLTPLYPAHVASLALRRKSVLAWVLGAQGRDGGWGYGPRADGAPSVLPTSYALMTLECFEPSESIQRAARRGQAWLAQRQRAGGRFPLRPIPRGLW
jgi:hypothetical protein